MQERPTLNCPVELYYQAVYSELSGSRPSGFGIGKIPLSEYMAYFDIHRIYSESERADIIYFCNQMDEELLTFYKEKSKKRPRPR